MMKFVALGLMSGILGLSGASPAQACGGSSCGMSAAPVATASANTNRSYSYQPGGTYRPQMMMRGGMMGGGSASGAPRSAGSKAAGN
jgi:hypothetical protein